MKKVLKLEELSVEQKLGLATISFNWKASIKPENMEYLAELVKNRALGGVWMTPLYGENAPYIDHLKELADYPLLVFTDAERGLGEYSIGGHNTIGVTDSEELAYTFGKITAARAAEMSYNVICNPILDMSDENCIAGGTMRGYGSDKDRVTALAAAEAQGMHDGGCLTIGKHYPGRSKGSNIARIDSHMGGITSSSTKEELLDYALYPCMELDKKVCLTV